MWNPLTCRTRSIDGEHREEDTKDQEDDSSPRNGHAEFISGIKWSRHELLLAPPDTAKDGGTPRKVITSDRKTEKRLRSRGRDQG